MLALVPKLRKNITSALLFATMITFVSCATQKDPPRLVNDPDEHSESTIPWNKQEKWELGSQGSAALGPTGSSDTR
jgi:hypothetical protein